MGVSLCNIKDGKDPVVSASTWCGHDIDASLKEWPNICMYYC